ncbi:hypothetical protein ACIPW5_11195 [Streptomyces sp. NPDC090077]|uniref:hypothetical protein n=1 Tax=Streptomyces sp. NPDC090077 TaxID=3365938 RepID=UPI003803C68A
MSPDVVWLCCTLAAALLLAWAWNGACREDRRWQRSARIGQDVSATRMWRLSPPLIEDEPGDPYSDDRIDAELAFIPHQTRRTEEDQ